MDETDAFFTQTIVGAPYSVLLGRRQSPSSVSKEGLQVSLGEGNSELSKGWKSWAVLDQLDTPAGRPRPRPKRLRRWLERHALRIALLGLLMLLGTGVFWAITLMPAMAWVPADWMERWPWN